MSRPVFLLMFALLCALAQKPALADGPSFGIALYGQPKYGPSDHFAWANPDAPKGGTLKLEGAVTFDTLNPFIVKGVPPAAPIDFQSVTGYLYQPLMMSSPDEPETNYGHVAETEEIASDRASVIFQIRRDATFNDGSPITADDVIWSFQMLTRPQMPLYHSYYIDVTKAEKVGERGVRFTFKDGSNRELPLIMGQLPILSKVWWSKHDLDKTTLEPPLGNGPYEVESVEPGRSITLRRVRNWWGDRLQLTRGLYNFDHIHLDFYRDETVALEAFKAGTYDFRQEQSAKNWATGYESPALAANQFTREMLPNGNPQQMQGFIFNTRREVFADRKVRQAIGYFFDFEWANRTLFYGAYTRARSFWNNSELGSSGLPSGAELALLETYRGKIPDEIFTTEYKPPVTDGTGNIRDNLREALKLFKEAGWSIKDKKLVNDKTGAQMEFEILLVEPAFERITLPFIQNLERAGINAHLRTIDAAQYQNRVNNFDYDMIVANWSQSPSPGNEQAENWGSEAADRAGSRNYAGIKNPVVDELVRRILTVKDYDELKTVTHALDRVLLSGYYLVPQYFIGSERVAYWDRLARPKQVPKYAPDFIDAWWMTPGKTSPAPVQTP
jgi:microcin C transport system substrate-binding protein